VLQRLDLVARYEHNFIALNTTTLPVPMRQGPVGMFYGTLTAVIDTDLNSPGYENNIMFAVDLHALKQFTKKRAVVEEEICMDAWWIEPKKRATPIEPENPGSPIRTHPCWPEASRVLFTNFKILRSSDSDFWLERMEHFLANSLAYAWGGEEHMQTALSIPLTTTGGDAALQGIQTTVTQYVGINQRNPRLGTVVSYVSYAKHGHIGGGNTLPLKGADREKWITSGLNFASTNFPSLIVSIVNRDETNRDFVHQIVCPIPGSVPEYSHSTYLNHLYGFSMSNAKSFFDKPRQARWVYSPVLTQMKMGWMTPQGKQWTQGKTVHGKYGEDSGFMNARQEGIKYENRISS
jgi:hypothetical protein